MNLSLELKLLQDLNLPLNIYTYIYIYVILYIKTMNSQYDPNLSFTLPSPLNSNYDPNLSFFDDPGNFQLYFNQTCRQ